MGRVLLIRVGVYAAYPALRAGLRALLEGADNLAVVATLAPGPSAIPPEVDVIVADFESSAERFDAPPGAVVVALVATVAQGVALLAGGAPPLGLLLREAEPGEVAAAVRAVAVGLVVIDPAIARQALRDRRRPPEPGDETPDPLTAREIEVLGLVATGLPNKAIGLRLGITENTVKFHVATILGKLNAASRAEAVMLGARHGILPL
jgi:DNA-binding NarL/FixJ family response regulator